MRAYASAAVAAAFTCVALSAGAQDYPNGPDNYQGTNVGGTNEIVIIGPHFSARTSPLNAPPEDVRISQRIPYADLDLRTLQGAHILRERVRFAAAQICDRLRNVYPYELNPHVPCFRAVLNESMPRAESAIDDARISARRGEYYGYYGGNGP